MARNPSAAQRQLDLLAETNDPRGSGAAADGRVAGTEPQSPSSLTLTLSDAEDRGVGRRGVDCARRCVGVASAGLLARRPRWRYGSRVGDRRNDVRHGTRHCAGGAHLLRSFDVCPLCGVDDLHGRQVRRRPQRPGRVSGGSARQAEYLAGPGRCGPGHAAAGYRLRLRADS